MIWQQASPFAEHMTTINQQEILKPSPFSLSIETEVLWETMTSKEVPIKNGLLHYSAEHQDFLKDLANVGLIGSVQFGTIYASKNTFKKRLQKAVELNLLKKHLLIRNKSSIPIYTLGATGMMLADLDYKNEANRWKELKNNDVLQRLVFYQLYGQIKSFDSKAIITKAEAPFIAAINRNDKSFSVLVVRGNDQQIKDFIRYEADKMPKRILMIVECINHIQPLMEYLRPHTDVIRVTTDHDLKTPFEKMFYQYHNQEWIKEYKLQKP